MIQVKLALMIRLTNWKVVNDIETARNQGTEKLDFMKLQGEDTQKRLQKQIDKLKKEKAELEQQLE